MTGIRRITLCAANATVTFRPAEHLPRFRFIFDAFVDYIAERLPDLADPLRDMATCRFRSLSNTTGHGDSPIHDKRYVESIEHPDREFLESLGEG